MSIRSQSLRLARALAKDIQPAVATTPKDFFIVMSRPLNRSLAAPSNYSSGSFRTGAELIRNFSTKPNDAQSSDGDGNSANEEETAVATEEDGGNGNEQETKITQLESQIKDLKDNLLRSLAEQENTRRIAARDVANAKSYAISSFAKSLLDTSDNLTRALESVPPELRDDRDSHPVLANLYEGISMTDEGLNKAFAKNGLAKFGARGEKFDPNLHEALFEYPDPECEAGNIGQVMKVGFMLNNRVLRPAEVGVVKAS